MFFLGGRRKTHQGKRKRNRWLSRAHAEQPLGIDDRNLDTPGEARHPKAWSAFDQKRLEPAEGSTNLSQVRKAGMLPVSMAGP